MTTSVCSPAQSWTANSRSAKSDGSKTKGSPSRKSHNDWNLRAHGVLPPPGNTLAGGSAMTHAGLAPEWIERFESLDALEDRVISLPSPGLSRAY